MTHDAPHPHAGHTVQLGPVHDKSGRLTVGDPFRVEDYWDRVNGRSWMFSDGNPAAMHYALRSGLSGGAIPCDDEVVYGKTEDGLGHLVHVCELATEATA